MISPSRFCGFFRSPRCPIAPPQASAGTPSVTVSSWPTVSRPKTSGMKARSSRGRGQFFGWLPADVLAPFLMVPHTATPTIFFGTIFVVVAIGAFIPIGFGRETVGQLETVTEGVPAAA